MDNLPERLRHMNLKPCDQAADQLDAYRDLHDGLSDMIEEGRLKEVDIPDDYRWLVEKLAQIAGLHSS